MTLRVATWQTQHCTLFSGLCGYNRVPRPLRARACPGTAVLQLHARGLRTSTPGAAMMNAAQPAGEAVGCQQPSLVQLQQQPPSAAQQQPNTEPQTPLLVNGSQQQSTEPQQAAPPEQQSAAAPQILPLAEQQRQGAGINCSVGHVASTAAERRSASKGCCARASAAA